MGYRCLESPFSSATTRQMEQLSDLVQILMEL